MSVIDVIFVQVYSLRLYYLYGSIINIGIFGK